MLDVNNYALHEIVRPIPAMEPASKTAGSTTNCTVISLKGIQKLGVLVENPAGSTITITATQATAVGDNGAKAFTGITEAWVGNNSADNLTRTSLISTPGTLTLAASKYATFDIDPSQLDLDNGFDCLKIVVTVAAGTSIPAVFYFTKNARYNSDTAHISAVAD